jgi:hypothetical protein
MHERHDDEPEVRARATRERPIHPVLEQSPQPAALFQRKVQTMPAQQPDPSPADDTL